MLTNNRVNDIVGKLRLNFSIDGVNAVNPSMLYSQYDISFIIKKLF